MFEVLWLTLNVLFGVPIAGIAIVGLREGLRLALALGFGFRIFEVKWGAGRPIFRRSLGPVDWVLAPWPWVASIVAESGSPKRHRSARLVQASGPLAVQIALAIGAHAAGVRPLASLTQGFDPHACLWIANGLLVAIHALIPLASRTGDRTDIRAILDIGFAETDTHRHARARYYARYACHWLERGDVARARSVLTSGATQLGRDPLVVDCEEQVLARDLASVVDQGDCATALRALIDRDRPDDAFDRRDSTLRGRTRRAAISALPLAVVALGWLAFESESVVRLVHARLVASSATIARDGDAGACESRLVSWGRWLPVFDRALSRDPDILRDRHAELARLERCRGRLDAAAAHIRRAIESAEDAAAIPEIENGTDSAAPLDQEIRLAEVLRERAEMEAERLRFKVALATLGRAESRLDVARRSWPVDAEDPERGHSTIENEFGQIALARSEILARMRGGPSPRLGSPER